MERHPPMYLLIALLMMTLLATPAAAEPVHPRLLLDAADVAPLRKRALTEPFASMVKAITRQLEHPHENVMYDNRVANLAILYLATGEKRHAAEAEKLAVAAVNDEAFWNNPRSKGLTRAGGARRVAIAYDLCYDAWSPETRTLVSAKLKTVADGMMRSMGAGANNYLPNNWQAVRYGGAGLAYLACDEPEVADKAKEAYRQLKRHLVSNLGSNGWNPEGIGYTQYPWQFTGPFGIAAFRAGLGDLRTEIKPVAATLWTTFVGTVAIPRVNGVGLRADLSDDHPGFNGEGTAALAFWYCPTDQLPAVRWMYDYLCGQHGDQSWDSNSAGGLYSLLLYPVGTPARNPAEVPAAGLTYSDPSAGIAIFRNRYRDEDDIVALVNGHARQPGGCHGGPDTNTFRIIGLGSCWAVGSGRTGDASGQTNLFAGPPGRPPREQRSSLGKLDTVKFNPTGDGSAITSGSCVGVTNHRRTFGVDYSGKSGAAAVFVVADSSDNGKLFRWNTPEFNQIKQTPNGFTLVGPTGATLAVTILQPANPVFRTGTFERGGGEAHSGFPYRGKKYINNAWIEFDCEGEVTMVATLQAKGVAAPPVSGTNEAMRIGKLSAGIRDGNVVFGE
jgi:hypothetical protein